MAARGGAREGAAPALVCSLIARPPPADAGIPGTAGGEGQARAAAAGNGKGKGKRKGRGRGEGLASGG
jgi:hypothetical protein